MILVSKYKIRRRLGKIRIKVFNWSFSLFIFKETVSVILSDPALSDLYSFNSMSEKKTIKLLFSSNFKSL